MPNAASTNDEECGFWYSAAVSTPAFLLGQRRSNKLSISRLCVAFSRFQWMTGHLVECLEAGWSCLHVEERKSAASIASDLPLGLGLGSAGQSILQLTGG